MPWEQISELDFQRGERGMDQITVRAAFDQVKPVMDLVNAKLAELCCSEQVRVHVNVAIDEIFGNIVQYAYDPEGGPVTVRVEVEDDPLCVVITFIDHGVPYDPLSAEFVDTLHMPAKERPIGGLGLFMVKRIMDNISYTYRDGKCQRTGLKN